jgi:hypothetical protein
MEPARPARVERWLAAILVVAAYSRLMGADEEAALVAFAILCHPVKISMFLRQSYNLNIAILRVPPL